MIENLTIVCLSSFVIGFLFTCFAALMCHANPYKIGMGHIIYFTERQSAIYRAIDDSLKGVDLRGLDYDRVRLEIMGAW